jgi:hypothetical protein
MLRVVGEKERHPPLSRARADGIRLLAVFLSCWKSTFLESRLEVLEKLMFARKVTALLKPKNIARFCLLMEQQVIPMLRNQNGFQDVLTLSAPGQDAVTTISLWDSALNAEIYGRATYYEVLKRLAALLEGTPKVDTYEVLNSTFHKIAVVAAA